MNIRWITTDAALSSACQLWQKQPALALDTEFIRVDTFYPIAGLIQVSDGQSSYLLDPLTIQDWRCFAAVLDNPNVVKILHACSEDLEVLHRLVGTLPAPLFDTQIACSYLNIGFSLGYSRLVENLLGVHLDKDETRSDWLQRPLTATQELYAAQDTLYLIEIYQRLQAQLSAEKYLWVLADGEDLLAQHYVQSQTIAERWKHIKLAWKLNAQQLAVLRAISQWREELARQRDVPRNRVLRENSLWELAVQQPSDTGHLSRIPEVSPKTVRMDGDKLLKIISQAKALPKNQWPELLPEPLNVKEAKFYKKIRSAGNIVAEQLNVAPEIVLRKKIAEEIVRTWLKTGQITLPDDLTGWRRAYLAPVLIESLRDTQ